MTSALRVLVFALLQFSASVYASTPSDCKTGACASQIDDATAMIQSRAKVSHALEMSKDDPMLLMKSSGVGHLLQVGGSERLAATQKMESSMELAVTKMINGNYVAPPPEFFEPIFAQIELIRQVLLDEKDNFQAQMTSANANVAQCNTNLNTTSESIVAPAKASADALKITHDTCRGAEKDAYDAKILSCAALASETEDVSNAAPKCNCQLSTTSDTSAVLSCLESNRNWVESSETVLKTKDSDCDNKTEAWSSKADVCDTDQINYEVAVCTYAEHLANMRSVLETCYNDAVSARTATITLVEAQEEHIKAMLASLKKIVCYLGVLELAGTRNITMSDFETCKYMDVESDITYLNNSVPDLNINYPPADPKGTDRFSWDLTIIPGDGEWAAQEYANFNSEWLRQTAVCPHLTTTTTTGLSIAYTATLVKLGGGNVSGEVTIFVTASGMLGAGTLTGLESNLIATPAGSNCTEGNGCGVHVHAGTGCASQEEQGNHFFSTSSDPWTDIRYSSTDEAGAASFTFAVDAGTTAIGGKPFIVHDNSGGRVACGILKEVADTKTATLSPLGGGSTTGVVTIYTTASKIYGAGFAGELEPYLADSSNGGSDCTKKNGCGVHVHSGSGCDTDNQGGHLKTKGGDDPWVSIRYASTSSSGSASFVFVADSDNTDVIGKPFIVHNNEGGRVACGLLSPAFATYTATVTELGSSGVGGDVTIFVTPNGLLGAGIVYGLEPGLAASGTNCTAKNGCGVHIHSGTGCSNTTDQGGHYHTLDSDPWVDIRYPGTDAQGGASFTFSVVIGTTDIEGKAFVVHNNMGWRVACGTLSRASATKATELSELSTSGVVGKVTIYSTTSMIFGAGVVSGLETNLDDSVNCTKENGCGVHVHSGSSCDSSEQQGAHLTMKNGTDPWTIVRYGSTTQAGHATFSFAVETDVANVSQKPFIVHNNAGGRVSCGILP